MKFWYGAVIAMALVLTWAAAYTFAVPTALPTTLPATAPAKAIHLPPKKILVDLDPDKMRSKGITAQDVIRAMDRFGPERHDPTELAALADLEVEGASGTKVKLGEIARIQVKSSTPEERGLPSTQPTSRPVGG